LATTLDELLQSIHPNRTLDQVDARADEAVNSFPLEAATIADWDDFRRCLSRFLAHVENYVLRLSAYPTISHEFSWSRCTRLLMKAYGPNGEKAALDMARTGVQGGLYAVLKAMASHIEAEYAGNEITARVHTYWNSLSAEEKWAAATKYLAEYGHLLPTDLTEASAARLRADFPSVLEQHPRLLRRFGRVGRY